MGHNSAAQFPAPSDYRHPVDLNASAAALARIPHFGSFLRRVLDLGFPQQIRNAQLANSIRLGPRQLPHIWRIHHEVCTTSGIDPIPELFLIHNPFPNAFTTGVDQPIVVLHSVMPDITDDAGLRAVLAHEAGHIHCGHLVNGFLLRVIARILNSQASLLPGLAVLSGLPLSAINHALRTWQRGSEMSCDRAAGLVTRDPASVCRGLLSLSAGQLSNHIDIEEYMAQAREYRTPRTALELLYRSMDQFGSDHPVMARIAEFSAWAESGALDDLASGRSPRPLTSAISQRLLAEAPFQPQSPAPPGTARRRSGSHFDDLAREHRSTQDRDNGAEMTTEEMGDRTGPNQASKHHSSPARTLSSANPLARALGREDRSSAWERKRIARSSSGKVPFSRDPLRPPASDREGAGQSQLTEREDIRVVSQQSSPGSGVASEAVQQVPSRLRPGGHDRDSGRDTPHRRSRMDAQPADEQHTAINIRQVVKHRQPIIDKVSDPPAGDRSAPCPPDPARNAPGTPAAGRGAFPAPPATAYSTPRPSVPLSRRCELGSRKPPEDARQPPPPRQQQASPSDGRRRKMCPRPQQAGLLHG